MATQKSKRVVTVDLGGEVYELDMPVDTVRAEGLPVELEGDDYVLVVVEGEEEAGQLESASTDPRLADVVWSTDVSAGDMDFVNKVSVVELTDYIASLPAKA